MCVICGQPDYIRCSCISAQPFCDQCAEDNTCIDKLDSACVIYHFGNPALPTRLINLDLPNGSSAQTIFETIDMFLGRSGNGPITTTDTNAIDLTGDGPGGRHLTATLILSQASGNTAVINSDGLFVPAPPNLYKVQVDGSHIPYYLEDALIGGTDGIVSLSFEPSGGILFGLPSINLGAVVNGIINNPTLLTTITGAVVNEIVNNPTFLSTITGAVENAILNDPNFITALTNTILNNPNAFADLCNALKHCASGTTACNAPIINGATSTLDASGGTSTLDITYTDASPIPVDGYVVFYREVGSIGAYTEVGPFPPSSSPIIIHGLAPSDYEGYVESDCGDDSFSSGATFLTSGFFSVNITNSLPNLSITNVTGLSGFVFSGPVNVGGRDTGLHNGFTGVITVVTTGTAILAGSLSLEVNGTTIQNIIIPMSTSPGTLAFTSHIFGANDNIIISLNT